jgi:alginate O-acetyltransferase complex protein AlgI
MLFFTVSYFLFFLCTLTCFYLAPVKLRKPLLLAASYFFYMSWNWKFIPLLLILTIVDYVAAIWIEDRQGPKRKWALIVSLISNLGFLAVFKYYNFAASNVATLLGFPPERFYFDVVLPLGISFHTFQSISYVVDVYRGEQRAVRKPLDYALFIAFFSQLVAGPIVRARNFFQDLNAWVAPNTEEIKRGAFLIVLGLVKKVALADNFALVSDRYFSAVASQPGSAAAWGGVFAFAMQIYFDFSGYTDMANRVCTSAWISFSGEFSTAVPGGQYHGFLAKMAYFPFLLAARLPVHSAGGEPAGTADDVSQPDADDASGRIVARGQLEFRHLGWVSWRNSFTRTAVRSG